MQTDTLYQKTISTIQTTQYFHYIDLGANTGEIFAIWDNLMIKSKVNIVV